MFKVILLLIFLCGYSFAQDAQEAIMPASTLQDSLPNNVKEEPGTATKDTTNLSAIAGLDSSIAQDSSVQERPILFTIPTELEQQSEQFSIDSAEQTDSAVTTVTNTVIDANIPIAVLDNSNSSVGFMYYENYIDSIIAFVKTMQPIKQDLETKIAAVNNEQIQPKSEYEKQSVYESRVANFGKDKQKKIDSLKTAFKKEQENKLKELENLINFKEDIQPRWDNMLSKDSAIEEYENRVVALVNKTSAMKIKTTNLSTTLEGLEIDKGDRATLEEKNAIYFSRLERAIELQHDYIVQERAKILTTPKDKFNMTLGDYDAEKEEFQMSMNDINSATIPFDYVGLLKISAAEAQAINRQTDDFLASVSYVNYPFYIDGVPVYPGAKKANVFYKDKEISNTGVFKNVPNFENLDGYMDWAVYADSLISGKVTPRNLDSLYVIKKQIPKMAKAADGSWWERNKNILRTTFVVLFAASTGVAVWQNNKATSQVSDMKITLREAEAALEANNETAYNSRRKEYNDSKDDLRTAENLRDGFFIGAGVFGVASILSFCF